MCLYLSQCRLIKMPTHKMSDEERRRRKRESERKRRAKRRDNLEMRLEDKIKRKTRYERGKKNKSIKMIGDMSAREQRNQRKKWKVNSKNYRQRKKILDHLISETPPQTPPLLGVVQRNANSGRRRVRRDRAKAYARLAKQTIKTKIAIRAANRYRQKYYRLLKQQNKTPSPKKEAKKLMKDIRTKEGREKVCRKLVFSFALDCQIKNNLKNMTSSQKQIYSKAIKGDILKRYKVLMAAGEIFPYKIYRSNLRRNVKNYIYERNLKKTSLNIQKKVTQFFNDEQHSRITPGKKDYIIKKKKKYQKRFLTDTMKNLYKKFVSSTKTKLSYASFCRFKPFYIVRADFKKRDTCLCIKHENMNLLIKKLNYLGILKEADATSLLRNLCCLPDLNEECLQRTCNHCLVKNIEFLPVENKIAQFSEWVTKSEVISLKGFQKKVRRTVKEEKLMTTSVAKMRLQNGIKEFMIHELNVMHQCRQFKYLRNKDEDTHLAIVIDFSENYNCKYASEPQSVHFGSSRQQLCLHTGVAYCGKDVFSFSTISEILRHDARSVATHMYPILRILLNKFSKVEYLHIMSDSPTQQYRNRTIFSFIGGVLPKIFPQLNYITWNYSEAGHGKGPADGVGGTLKRTADRTVSQNNDINNIQKFLDCLKTSNIFTRLIDNTDFDNMENILKDATLINPVKNTMKIHQVTWSKSSRELQFNSLSCFSCDLGVQCEHYSVTPGIKIPEDVQETLRSPTFDIQVNEGDWVALIFEGNWVLGIVEAINALIVVNCLERSDNSFHWPANADRKSIQKKQILYKLKNQPESTSANKMTVNELKYIDFLLKNISNIETIY